MLGSRADVGSEATNANGSSANPHAVEIMHSRFGIDISSHRSRNVKDVRVGDFDYVVALDDSVSGDLRKMYPDIDARLISWNIDDPICKGIEAYERSARRIQKHLKELSTCLIERNGTAGMS